MEKGYINNPIEISEIKNGEEQRNEIYRHGPKECKIKGALNI